MNPELQKLFDQAESLFRDATTQRQQIALQVEALKQSQDKHFVTLAELGNVINGLREACR